MSFPARERSLLSVTSQAERDSAMLLLFGRFKEPARAVTGIAGLVIGIVFHIVIITALGAALLVWAGVNVLRAQRGRRGRRAHQPGSQDDGQER
jgi:hypothetical protein